MRSALGFVVCLMPTEEWNCLRLLFLSQTAFLQGLLGRSLRYQATLNKQHLSNFTINTLQVYGQEKYLMVSGGFA